MADPVVRITVSGARGPMGPASGPLGAGSVTAETVSNDGGEQTSIREKIGAADLVTEQLGIISGIAGNAPSITQFPGHNFLNSGASASAVMAGTVDQPNVVGGQGYIQTFTGDGVEDTFIISPGFTVDSAAYRNILVYLVTRSTGAEVLQNEGFQYSVSGKGTGTITITMNTAPTAAQDVRVRVYRKQNSAYSPLLNFAGFGYDNFNDGSGSMTIQFGAHHVNIGNTGGHNTFGGGANSVMRGGTSYSFAAGLSHDFNNSLAGFAGGMRGKLSSTTPAHFGASGKVGGWSVHFGELGEAETFYSAHFGRKGKTAIAGDLTIGAGVAADSEAGFVGSHEYPLRRQLTTATTTQMIPITGAAHFQMPENSKAFIEAEVLLSEVGTGAFRKLKLVSCVRRESGSTMSFLANSTYADQATVEEENDVSASGGEWQAQIYTSASGGFVVQGRGKAGLIINAFARVKVLLVADAAAA